MLERWKDYLSARYRRQQVAVGAGLFLLLSLGAMIHEESPPVPVPPTVSRADAPVTEPPQVQPRAETPLVLRGIVTGADGRRIAILARGKDSAALAAGDTWHGYTLDALTERMATLRTAHGVITLTRE